MSESIEIWRPVAIVPGYEVSNLGRVRHAKKGTIKGAPIAKNGYRVVNLWHRNIGRVCTVHQLVAEAFLGPFPKGMSVNHIDCNKLNNSPENLEYVSLSENSKHQYRMGRTVWGEKSGQSKLTNAQAAEIRRRARGGERTCDLAREFGVGSPIISQIKFGTRWHNLP